VDGDWASSHNPRVRARRERPVGDFAREELGRRATKVGKRAKKIAKLDPRKRHKLRIAAKKVRYATEFFRSLYGRRKAEKRLGRYVGRLKSFQDCLGALNDITVHRELARDFVRERARERQSAFAIGVVSSEEENRTGPLCDAAIAAAGKLAKARQFWT
jgi:CHAD domain-containing protein